MTAENALRMEAAAVTVKAGPKCLVDAVDLELAPGRVEVLLGPNGAGKSTLLRAMTGEAALSDGSVTFEGRPIEAWDACALARRRACLPQSSTLSFPFTIREVVGIGRFPHGDTRMKTAAAVEASLGQVGLLEQADEPYTHLSGGEKQRVHLARVLAQLESPEGKVLLLDEPTASLDLTFQQLVFRIATEWADGGAAVLLVLHDLNQAMRYADSVTVMDGGRVAVAGRPVEVLRPDLIEAVYGVRSRWVESGDHRLLAVEESVPDAGRTAASA